MSSPISAPPVPPVATPSSDERLWAMLCHLSALIAYTGLAFLFANIIAPLVLWLIKKDQLPFVNDQGKEAVNFQISMTIYAVACFPLIFIFIGIPLLIAVGIADLILAIIAAIKANQGIAYRYPMTIRFIK